MIGFFVGLGFGRAGVVLSQGDFVFVTKFGSVVTCHGVDDQESKAGEEVFVRKKKRKKVFQILLAETLAAALNSFEESLKLSNGFFIVVVGFGLRVVDFVLTGLCG